MIALIISIIAAIGASVWALFEREAKNLLSSKLETLTIDDKVIQTELSRMEALLEEEKALLAQERRKTAELTARLDAEMMTKSAIADDTLDIAGLVDVTEEFKMDGHDRVVFFEFYKDKSISKEIRWRLKAKNNKVIADSGEGYGTKQNLKKALGVMIQAIKSGEIKSRWKS
jgi:uncharacterized protein YegP (UPF0339 family)